MNKYKKEKRIRYMLYLQKFFFLFKSKKKLILMFLYFIALIISVLFIYKGEYGSIPENELIYMKSNDPEMGLDFFYFLQGSGLTLTMFILTSIIIPNIISSDFLSYNNNKFDNLLITRITTDKYNKTEKNFNFIATFIVILLTHLITLIVIHLFCFKISFSINEIYLDATRQTNLFSNSLMLSLIIYIILSSLGYALFSNFIFSLQAYIKNIYLYRTLGICTSLILYIGASVLSRYLYDFTGSMLFATIAYFINVSNILSPGIIKSPILSNNSILFYIGTSFLYCLITLILFKVKGKNKYVYDK